MDYASVKEWLDLNVKIRADLAAAKTYNEHIMACVPKSDTDLLMLSGIEEVADIMGIELVLDENWSNEELPYKYCFEYEGIQVVQLCRERLV